MKEFLFWFSDFDGVMVYHLTALRKLKTITERDSYIRTQLTPYVDTIAQQAKAGNYQEIIIGIATNRQTWVRDFYNGNMNPSNKGSGSALPVYEALASAVEKAVPKVKVRLFEGMMPDVIHELEDGKAFHQINNINQKFEPSPAIMQNPKKMKTYIEKMNERYALYDCPFDSSKISLLFYLLNWAGCYAKGKSGDVIFVDDSRTILTFLKDFFKDEFFTPENLTFKGYLCAKGIFNLDEKSERFNYPGKGVIYKDYREAVILFIAIAIGKITNEISPQLMKIIKYQVKEKYSPIYDERLNMTFPFSSSMQLQCKKILEKFNGFSKLPVTSVISSTSMIKARIATGVCQIFKNYFSTDTDVKQSKPASSATPSKIELIVTPEKPNTTTASISARP